MKSNELLPKLKPVLTDWLNTHRIAVALGLKMWQETELKEALHVLQDKGFLTAKQTNRGRYWRLRNEEAESDT